MTESPASRAMRRAFHSSRRIRSGRKSLGQKNRATLTFAEALARPFQRGINIRLLRRHFNPTRIAYFLGSGKAPPVHCHFMVNFDWDQNAFVE